MARTYKRDSNGRFAGGGGSGGSSRGRSGGGRRGRPAGPSGGKVGSSTQQKKAAAAQAARTKAFSSKAMVSSGKAAYKEALSRARLEKSLGYRGAMSEVKAMQRKRAATPGVGGKKSPASGRKVGSTSQQKRATAAQAARTAQFSSKAAPNSAKSAYKAARSDARFLRRQNGGRAGDAFSRVRRMERTRTAAPKKRGRPRKAA